MALDPNIIFQSRAPTIADPAQTLAQTAGLAEMFAGTKQREALEAERVEDRARVLAKQAQDTELLSIVRGFEEVKPLIKAGKFKEAKAIAQRRFDRLSQAGRTPEQLEDTQEMINALGSNDPSQILQLQTIGDSAVEFAERTGVLSRTTAGDVVERFSPTTTTLNDGTTIQTSSTGRKIVTDVSGSQLEGKAAADAIRTARATEVEQVGEKSGARKRASLEEEKKLKPSIEKQNALAKDAAKLSTEIFTRIGSVEANIENLKEGIRLIDAGAASGPIDKWFPSLRPTTISLNNLKNRLGLDVIGQVTFGALSESELKVAFDTAVPSNLDEKDLKKWFSDRIDVQQRLVESLEESGIFLAEDGATLPKLLARKRSARKAAKATKQEQSTPAAQPSGQSRLDELRAKAGL